MMLVRCKTAYFLVLLLACSTYGKSVSPKKRVCVIGAGVSGLVAVKYLSSHPDEFETIAFEKNSEIGGQWVYTENSDVDEHGLPVHSSVYKYMRTNSPKEFMAFPDYQEFHGENRSYVSHRSVLEYLRNYTTHFNLHPYIQLKTLVEKVSPISDSKWQIETQNLNTHQKNVTVCDAVIVGSGHYFKPNIPRIAGIEKYPGRVLHSHAYRKPEDFTNQTVAILGASYSGMDIGIDVSRFAKKIYLSHRHETITAELPKNIEQVPGVVKADEEGLILSNGSKIIADSFIFCTGYLYEFAFLDESSGVTVTKGKYVHPVYKHLVNINNPTMFFINLPDPSFMFLIANGQVQYVVALLEGKVQLPSREVMLEDAKIPEGRPISKVHLLEADTFDYYNELARIAGFQLLDPTYKDDVEKHVIDRNSDPLHFKEKVLQRRADGRWELVLPNN